MHIARTTGKRMGAIKSIGPEFLFVVAVLGVFLTIGFLFTQ